MRLLLAFESGTVSRQARVCQQNDGAAGMAGYDFVRPSHDVIAWRKFEHEDQPVESAAVEEVVADLSSIGLAIIDAAEACSSTLIGERDVV